MLIALLAVLGVDLIVLVTADGATVEIAARAEDTELQLGPYRELPTTRQRKGNGSRWPPRSAGAPWRLRRW